MDSLIRVRFAPSPTGELHIGNVRTAILNWIFAKKHNGKFILRIEDTDLERSTKDSEISILNNLRWLGLQWDEGPDKNGDFGPYRQSERYHIYNSHIELLKQSGSIYPCYKTSDELERIRQDAQERGDAAPYNRKNLEASADELNRFLKEGRKPAWFFAVNQDNIEWDDLVKGRIGFTGDSVGDFVVTRSDGSPTYNFAAAIDDALMKITHVIRGDDHVSNTPKQILLYKALNFEIPKFAHIPMILGPDKARLSKRHGATSLGEFKEKGYLPETLINFLSLLSWSSESEEEILSIERLVNEFDFTRMSKSPAVFDMTKLNWMNRIYLRNLTFEHFVEIAMPFVKINEVDDPNKEKLLKILLLLQDQIDYLSQINEMAELFYRDIMQPTDGDSIEISSRDSSQKVYWAFLRHLNNYDTLDPEIFKTVMKNVQKETGIMGKDLWMPIRVALTGKLHGPDLGKIAEILGKERIISFVRNLVD